MATSGEQPRTDTCTELDVIRMKEVLQMIFPQTGFGEVMGSVCRYAEVVGEDRQNVLIFKEGADLSGLKFLPLGDVPEGLPTSAFDALTPELGVRSQPSNYVVAYGFSHDANTGAYILRRADGKGSIVALLADLM